jgi:hypothetical protein
MYAYWLIAGLLHGEPTLISSSESSTDAANLYASHTVKFDNAHGDSSGESIVIPQAKPKYSQTFHESSSEDSLVSLVEETILKNPEQACEVVKQAIGMSKAQESLICRIVETAILAAPDQIRLITQCAIASAPDSLTAIQLLIATYDASGDSGTSGKEVSGKEVSGKEVSGKELFATEKAQKKLDVSDVMRRTELGTPSTSSPLRLNPVGNLRPSLISPNSTTKTDTPNP